MKWEDVHYLILPDLPGCPITTVDAALAASASEFCAETHIWRENLDFQYTIKNLADYDVDGTEIIETVLWVVVDGQVLTHLDARHVDKTRLTDTGRPEAFWVVDDTAIRLFPIPDSKERMEITVALKPSRSAEEIPDWIYESYIDPIISGAIARLTRVIGKEWSNPDLSMFHQRLFEQGKTEARVRDFRNTKLRVKPPKFGG